MFQAAESFHHAQLLAQSRLPADCRDRAEHLNFILDTEGPSADAKIIKVAEISKKLFRDADASPKAYRELLSGALDKLTDFISMHRFTSEAHAASISSLVILREKVLEYMPSFSADELSQIMRACIRRPSLIKTFGDSVAKSAYAKIPQLSVQGLVDLLSIAESVDRSRELVTQVAERLLEQKHKLSTPALAFLAERLVKRGVNREDLVASLMEETLERIPNSPLTETRSLIDSAHQLCQSQSSQPGDEQARVLSTHHKAFIEELQANTDSLKMRLATVIALHKKLPSHPVSTQSGAIEAIVAEVMANPEAFSVSDLVDVTSALAFLFKRDGAALSFLVPALQPALNDVSDSQFASLVACIGNLGYRDDSFMRAVSEQISSRLATLSAKEVALISQGLYELNYRDVELMSVLADSVASRRPEFNFHQVACVALPLALTSPEKVSTILAPRHLNSVTDSRTFTRCYHAVVASGQHVGASDVRDRERTLYRAPRNESTKLEKRVASFLEKHLDGTDAVVKAGWQVSGIETDILIETPQRRFAIEVDGSKYHNLIGPDAQPGMTYGQDSIQDVVYSKLGYEFFHFDTDNLISDSKLKQALEPVVVAVKRSLSDGGPGRLYL